MSCRVGRRGLPGALSFVSGRNQGQEDLSGEVEPRRVAGAGGDEDFFSNFVDGARELGVGHGVRGAGGSDEILKTVFLFLVTETQPVDSGGGSRARASFTEPEGNTEGRSDWEVRAYPPGGSSGAVDDRHFIL